MHIEKKDALVLTEWYEKNKRNLPWRDTGDPYDVWLSEIMLQQTRIEAVIPKYLMFKQELPDIASLAACSEDHLMRLWEGLGYYSRARNLQKCARILMKEYGGKLPSDYQNLLKLPGIGTYTAGAIASIAFGQAVPAVDGNVLRVIARYFDCHDDIRDKTVIEQMRRSLDDIYAAQMSPVFYRNFNQGLMELGETICLPNGVPDCDKCPWSERCQCRRKGDWKVVPYRSSLKKRRIEERTLLVMRQGDRFLLHKRPDQGLLAGLYEFFGVDKFLSIEEVKPCVEELGLKPSCVSVLPESKHIFTHVEWHMKAYEVEVENIESVKDSSFIAADREGMEKMAIPSAFKKYVRLYRIR